MYLQRRIFGVLTLSVAVSTAFVTEPFIPPIFNVSKSGLPLASGLIFMTPTGPLAGTAVIMTNGGELIWSSPSGSSYGNLLTTTLDSQPVLTLWNGTGSESFEALGHGYGKVQIFDTTYTEIYSLCPDFNLSFPPNMIRPECQADTHESYLTERGSMIMSAYNYTQADLTSIGGPADGWIYDVLFFDVDIKTQKILFSWSAAAHVPINSTKLQLDGAGTAHSPFDFFHINSIQSVGDGYVVNGRHVWTVYKVDSRGEIEWEFEVCHPLYSYSVQIVDPDDRDRVVVTSSFQLAVNL